MTSTEGAGARTRSAVRGLGTGLVTAVLLAACATQPPAPTSVEDLRAAVDARMDSGDGEGAAALIAGSLDALDAADAALWALERAELLQFAGLDEQARLAFIDAARRAASAGDVELLGAISGSLEQLIAAPPADADARMDAISMIDGADAQEALEFVDVLREDLYAFADAGDLDGAVQIGEEILAIAEDSFGPSHRVTLDAAAELGNVYFVAGDPIGAETVLSLAAERAEDTLGVDHPYTTELLTNLADVYESQGRADDALVMIEQAQGAPDSTGVLRLRQARLYEALGRYEDGALLLEDTCEVLSERFGRYHPRSADCRAEYATLLGRGGDLAGARSAIAELAVVRSAIDGPLAATTLQARIDAAALARRAGEYDAALDALTALEADVFDSGDAELLVALEETRARVYFDLGDTAAASESAEFVLAEREATYGADHPLTLDALNLVGGVRYRAGDLMGAEEAWITVYEGYLANYGEASLNTITASANLGLVYETQGLYDSAEPLLRDAVDLSSELLGSGHPQTLTSMNNLALLHESQGQFDRAEPLYLLPIEVLSSTLGEAHPRTISVMNNLAYLYMLEERLDEARASFERVRTAFATAVGEEHQDTLKALNNLGRVQRRLGDLDAAEVTIGRALDARRRTLGEAHIDTLRSMRDLGVVFLEQGRLDEAEALLKQTLDADERALGAQHPYTFEALSSLADVYEAQARLDDAFELRRTGFERRSQFLDRMLWVTSDNAREGYVRLHRDELDAYLSLLPQMPSVTAGREALEVSLQRKGLLLQISSQIQQIAQLGLDPELAALAERLSLAREALAARTLAGPEGGDPEAHLEAIRELENEVEALQSDLGRASLRYRESIAGINAQDLYDALPDGSSLVDFLAFNRADGSRGLMAGILQREEGGDPLIDLIVYEDLDEIEGIVQEYREIIQDEGAGDDEILELGNIAWEMIWEPVTPLLPEDGPVYLVPDGVLNILPFDALVDADERYLIETTDLRILSSARELLPSEMPPAVGAVLVLAGPDYDTEDAAGVEVLAEARGRRAARRSATVAAPVVADEEGVAPAAGTRGSRAGRFEAMRGVSLDDLDSRSAVALASLRAASSGLRGLSFSPLPGAEREGNLIDEQVTAEGGASVIYTQGEAEEQLLNDLKTPPRVLHIATHGFFLEPDEELRARLLKAQRSADIQIPPPGDNPLLRAGLAFAGINSNAPFLGEIDTRNDGVLTALEVLSLDLSGTELAVLSACETGLGEIHEGEGVYGLRRAFQEAGVDKVVTSLWEVSDAGTQALMTEMYQRLLAGAEPRVALREAQRELMASPRWGYPYVWSAFMIVGN